MMQKFVAAFVHRNVLANLLTVAILLIGVISMFTLKREAFPRIEFDIVIVETVFPGASPEEVEKLVTIPIEREIKGLDGIKTSSSSSLDSRSAVVLTLDPDIDDKLSVIQDIRDAVDRAEQDFPGDAEEPYVMELTSSQAPVIEVAVNTRPGSEKVPEGELRGWADRIEDDLELLPAVASVEKRGYRDREIFVEVLPDRLFYYNISADEIASAIAARNINFPGGEIVSGGREYTLRTVKEFESAEQIANLEVRANDIGQIVRVKDVARVRDGFEEKDLMEKANGEEAIILTVLKRDSGDTINVVDAVEDRLEKMRERAPENIQISTMNDISYFIRRRLSVLIGNVSIGLVLVSISLLLFLGWRVALMVAIGIPFAFAATFLGMKVMGVSINLLSLFGLVIVSGMIVDDAIVVGENVYRYMEKGLSPVRAAIKGTSEMIAPVSTAVFTTIIAFAPLMFIGGIMGKFMWSLPAVVIIALVASLVESFIVLPVHLVDVTGNKRAGEVKSESRFEARIYAFLVRIYRPALEWAYDHRYTVIVMVIFVFIGAMSLLPRIGFILFPKNSIESIYIKAEAEQGINLEEMARRMEYFEKGVSVLPENEVTDFTTRIGILAESSADPFTKRGKNYGQVTLFLTPENDRDRTGGEIISYLQRKLDPDIPVSFAAPSVRGDSFYIMRPGAQLEERSLSNPLQILRSWKVDSDTWLGGAYLPDENKIIAYTLANEWISFSLESGAVTQRKKFDLRSFDSPVSFAVHAGEKDALLFSELGDVFRVSLQKPSLKKIGRFHDSLTSAHFSDDGKTVYLTGLEGTFEGYNYLKKWKKVFSIKQDRKKKPEKMPPLYDALLQDSNAYLAAGSGFVYNVDLKEGKIKNKWPVAERALQSVQSSGSSILVSAGDVVYRLSPDDGESSQVSSVTGSLQHIDNLSGSNFFPGTNGLLARDDGKALRVLQKGVRWIEKIEYKQAGGGPPVGDPVQLEIRGDEFPELLEVADIAKKKLALMDGVYDIRDNWETGREEFHLEVNETRAAMAGVSVTQIASTVQTFFDGRVSTSIKKAKEEIDIRVILPEQYRTRLDSLRDVKVRNTYGNLVPITELAWFKKQDGVSLITHSDFTRTLYVRANIDENRNSSVNVNRALLEEMNKLKEDHPDIIFKAGGEFEDTQESMQDLGIAFLIAILGILGVLVLMFGNLRHPRVVMTAIPLGMIGVSITFFLHKMFFIPNLTFSFIASFGVIGLAGVVVNDSIVLVDFINRLRQQGKSRRDAVIEAGVTRLRAVVLTTVTTVFGLLPTAYGLGGNDPFLKPMALAMAWGLAFATAVTLIIIPVYYSIWEDRGYIFHRVLVKYLKIPERKNGKG